MNIGNILCFFWCGCKTNLCGGRKIFQDFSPCRIFCSAPPVTLINNNQIKKIFGKIFIDVLELFSAGNRLIKGKIYFIRRVYLTVFYLCHCRAERLEIIYTGLINKDISVSEK